MGVARRNWPLALLILVALVVSVVSFAAGGGAAAVAGAVGSWVPTLAFALQWSYHHHERTHLAVNRLRLRATNADVALEVVGEYQLHDWTAVGQIRERLETLGGKVEVDNGRHAAWDLHGLRLTTRLEALDEHAGGGHQLRLEIKANRGFRSLEHVLEHEITPTLEAIDQVCGRGDRKFVSRVTFAGSNPYFGLWVRNADQRQVSRFDIELREPSAGRVDRVRVNGDRIEVVTQTVTRAHVLTRRYLAVDDLSRVA